VQRAPNRQIDAQKKYFYVHIEKNSILSQKDPTLFLPIVRLILALETAHGAGHQLEVLFLIDNSQCHSAYSEDALFASRMNVKPGAYGQRVVLERRAENHSELKNSAFVEAKGKQAILKE
jgi:hypothetical protein